MKKKRIERIKMSLKIGKKQLNLKLGSIKKNFLKIQKTKIQLYF